MENKITDRITTVVRQKVSNIYAMKHYNIASNLFDDMTYDRKKAVEELEKQVGCAVTAFNCVWDILVNKNYITRDEEDGKYSIVGADTDEADSVKANDILMTAAASLSSAFSIKHKFLVLVDKPAIEYYSCRSTLAGICLLMSELIEEASYLHALF